MRHVDDDLYIMERTGWQAATGLVFVLNNRGDGWNGTYVDTTRPNTVYRPVAWGGRDTDIPEPTEHGGRTAAASSGRRPAATRSTCLHWTGPPHPNPLLRFAEERRPNRIRSGPFSPLAGRRLG